MCRIYNTVGALSDIQSELVKHKLDEFSSLQELVDFDKQYEVTRLKLISDHHHVIEEEKLRLTNEIAGIRDNLSGVKVSLKAKTRLRKEPLYDESMRLFKPDARMITILTDVFKNMAIWMKIWAIHLSANLNYWGLLMYSECLLYHKGRRLKFIDSNFDTVVNKTLLKPLKVLEKKHAIVHRVKYSIYGAFGEQEVVNVLKDLSDEFTLINNFSHTFHPALLYKPKDYIKSVQIDHILIAPSGVFLIETKNWSRQTLEDNLLRSPIDQIKRANHALFTLLINAKPKSIVRFKKHPWGNKLARIRNVVVFTKAKGSYEDGFVEVIGIEQLLSYITSFPPAFNSKETEAIAKYLLSISTTKAIASILSA